MIQYPNEKNYTITGLLRFLHFLAHREFRGLIPQIGCQTPRHWPRHEAGQPLEQNIQIYSDCNTHAIQDAITLQYPESQAVLFSEGRLASRHGILCWYPSVETAELRAVQNAAAFTC